MSNYIYGIDFGTTNSALVVFNVGTNQIEKIFTTPSVLFFPDNESAENTTKGVSYQVGEEAIKHYAEQSKRGRFMKSIKKVLPNKTFKETKIHGKPFNAEELVSLILLSLTQQADLYVGTKVTTAVMGRPVVFDENPEKDAVAQARLEKAAQLVGLKELYFQFEPIGAAFTYERQLQKEELVLVADFGGGTSDFTLMKLTPNAVNNANRKSDMLGEGGIYIGGDNFDSAMMWEKGTPHFGRGLTYQSQPNKWLPIPITFFHNICSWEKMNFFDSQKIKNDVRTYYNLSGQKSQMQNLRTLIDHNLGYSMFKVIEKTKVELSNAVKAWFSFHQEGIDFDELITVDDFEHKIIQKELAQITEYLLRFLEQQNVSPAQIDTVFMTGGTSLVKPLQNQFIRIFGQEKIKSGDNFNSVAMGLAYSYLLFQ